MLPDLEERFLQPDGWRWGSFERAGRTIRFGYVLPDNKEPDAIVICLQGVREFSEKYFETARWCQERNFAFWTFDWAGQGKSTRYLEDPQKRHSAGFDEDINDFHYLMHKHIIQSNASNTQGSIPLTLLAHSMGANLGLRYLHLYPETFRCAAFTAPMIGIKKFENLPQRLAIMAAFICKVILGKSYIPEGQNWENRKEHARLSHDPIRSKIHNLWCAADPDLQCGDVTFGWVYEAQRSCTYVQRNHKQIPTPRLFAIPGHEDLVDNKIARESISDNKMAKIIDYPEAFHEILMEVNDVRNDFLDHFYELIRETIID